MMLGIKDEFEAERAKTALNWIATATRDDRVMFAAEVAFYGRYGDIDPCPAFIMAKLKEVFEEEPKIDQTLSLKGEHSGRLGNLMIQTLIVQAECEGGGGRLIDEKHDFSKEIEVAYGGSLCGPRKGMEIRVNGLMIPTAEMGVGKWMSSPALAVFHEEALIFDRGYLKEGDLVTWHPSKEQREQDEAIERADEKRAEDLALRGPS